MTQTPALPNYADIADLLTSAESTFNPAQLHGLLCGYVCATSGQDNQNLEEFVLKKSKKPKYRELIQELYEISYHQMSEFSFEFALLLPGDNDNINARTEALGLWCQGFLTGLEQSNIPIKNREESDVTETLNDFIEIAQVNYGEITDNDEDETAYFELMEYVRLGVLMIFQDLKTGNPDQLSDENRQLH